jgi:hypothetical protein
MNNWVTKTIGKVDAIRLSPNLIKIQMNTIWVWDSGIHIERAIVELSKECKINSTIKLIKEKTTYLLFVD